MSTVTQNESKYLENCIMYRKYRLINIWTECPSYPTIGCQVPTLFERNIQYMCNIMGPDYLRCMLSFSHNVGP